MNLFPGLPDNPRCCAYLRKSRRDEGRGDTLAHHRAIISRTAEINGHVISEWLEEIVSGETIEARPQMKRLLRSVANREWDAVYVVEAPRLGRGGGSDQEKIVNAFTLTNTWLITPSGAYMPSSERDMRALRHELRSSEDELEWIKTRLVQGREQAVREGCWINTATVPYGWQAVRVDGRYQLVPKEPEHSALRLAWELAESGETLNSIARRLESMGARKSRGGFSWTSTHVRNLLTCRAHCGYTYFGKERDVKAIDPDTLSVVKVVDRSKSNYIEARGLWWDRCQSGEWGVSEERFDAMQARMSANAKVKEGFELKNPLAGLLRCSKCGRSMVYKAKRESGRMHECFSHMDMRHFKDECWCRSAPVPLVLSLLADGLRSIAENLDEEIELSRSDSDSCEAARAAVRAEISAEQSRLERIMDAYEDGAYSVSEFRERKDAVESRLTSLVEELENLVPPSPEELELKSMKVSKLIDVVEDPSVGASIKHDLLASLIERIEFSDDSPKNSRSHNINLEVFLR